MTKFYLGRDQLIRNLLHGYPNLIGVEIGTFKGAFSKTILENCDCTLYMVDVWRGLENYVDVNNQKETSHENILDAMKNIEGLEDRGIMLRTTSEKASKLFENKSLDFVYIDANHSYEYVVKDIELWFPKVKSGGIVMGHDYLGIDWYDDPNFLENNKDKHIWGETGYLGIFGVNPAVDEFCKQHGYNVGVTDEWFGTWFFKKR